MLRTSWILQRLGSHTIFLVLKVHEVKFCLNVQGNFWKLCCKICDKIYFECLLKGHKTLLWENNYWRVRALHIPRIQWLGMEIWVTLCGNANITLMCVVVTCAVSGNNTLKVNIHNSNLMTPFFNPIFIIWQ